MVESLEVPLPEGFWDPVLLLVHQYLVFLLLALLLQRGNLLLQHVNLQILVCLRLFGDLLQD